MPQGKEVLKALGKQHRVKRYRNKPFSKLTKADLSAALQEKGVEPPPRPLENLNRKELVAFSQKPIELIMKTEVNSILKN